MQRQGGADRRRPYPVLLALALASVFFARGAVAQALPFGIGEDAALPPAGTLRFAVRTDFTFADELRRADGSRAPLGVRLADGSLGAADIPSLRPVESALRTAGALSGFTLSLGATTADAAVTVTRVPISLEYGVTRWLSLGVSVPLVRRHVDVQLRPNASGVSGNVGLNPYFASATSRAAAIAFHTSVLNAETSFAAALTQCNQNPGGAGCGAVLANATLATDAATLRQAIATIYGGGAQNPSAFVPLVGSGIQAAIATRVAALRAAFQEVRDAGAAVDVPDAPEPDAATAVVGTELFGAFVTDPATGLGASAIRPFTHTNVGDIDASVQVALFDGFARDGFVRLRGAVTGTVRIGAGPSRDPANFIDPGSGDGQNDLELRVATDVALGRRFATTVIVGQTWQRPDRQQLRAGDALFLPATATRTVNRDLGDITAVDVMPRYALTRFIALSASASHRRKSADRHADGAPSEGWGLVAAPTGAFHETRAGVGVVFSTRQANRRILGTPVEIVYQHARTVASGGAAIPITRMDQIGGRIYLGSFR